MTCLIKEDGTQVVGANTYIDAEEAELLLNEIGETYGDTPQSDIELHLLKAMRMLESYRTKFQGTKVTATQPLQWPRCGAKIDGFDVASTTIPTELKMAQAITAMLTVAGNEIQMTSDGRTIIQETIAGAISVTYSNDGTTGSTMSFPILDTYLKSLLKSSSASLQVWRP